MAVPMDDQLKALLNPTKNAEDSFKINLAEILENYLELYVKGHLPTNFNSAALLIQGSSNLYGKRVEYLYNLASNLHEYLTKNNHKDDPKKKDTSPKERAKKHGKTFDPFCSTEIKVGKHLSCLRKKNIAKATAAKKSTKKTAEKKHAFVPVDLLPLEGEEKGDVFYDTRGEAIGNKNDYTLNKCRITKSGWLLMPTVSPDNITQESSSPSSSLSSPEDEGYPASSGCPSTVPPSQTPSSSLSQPGSSQQTDEGLGSMGSTPMDAASQPVSSSGGTPMEEEDDEGAPNADIENIPLDDLPTDEEFMAPSMPVRRSVRVLQELQKQTEERKQQSAPKNDLIAVLRPIEKNSTFSYSRKKPEKGAVFPASKYCARTFFSVDTKLQKSDLFSLQVTAFANNSKFMSKIKKYKEAIKAAKAKRRANGEVLLDDEDVQVDSPQPAAPAEREEDENNTEAPLPPADDDFDYEDAPLPTAEENPFGEGTSGGGGAEEECPSFDFAKEEDDRIDEQIALFRDDLQTVEQTAEMTARVREWQKKLKPFLEEIKQREKFDINQYGARILDAFEESNRRQTMMFKQFCEGKEKYEIHRYFLALLPLVNVGNVRVCNEPSEDGIGEDISITLLSRKMHHMELEEFGHNEGQHE